jgi:outer membrane biosynthesis protein TonB
MNKPPEDHEFRDGNPVAVKEPPQRRRAVVRPIPRVTPATRPPGSPKSEFEEEEDGFFARHRALLIVASLIAAAVVWFTFFHKKTPSEPVRKIAEPRMVMVQLPPPPPPPTPAPKLPPPPPKDDKRPEQAPTEKPKAEEPKPKPAEKPPEGLGTNNKGPGPGMAGLGSSGNGVIGGSGSGGGGGGSMARWYAGQLQGKISDALRANPKTRKASLRVDVQVWVDGAGKVTRASLLGTTGDAGLDEVLNNQILKGLQLPEPPPRGMKMPVALRLTARRPS